MTNYRPTFLPVLDQQERLHLVIRLFNQNRELHALLVDPYSLATSRAKFSTLKLRKSAASKNLPGYFSWKEIEDTPYMRLIRHCTSTPNLLQNDGIKHALGSVNGFFLTVDMCPSSNPFEKEFFHKLANLMPNSAPFEVGISMSGLWMLGHPQEFAWLCEQHSQGRLRITWINHTFRHLYFKDLPLEKNFMRFNPIMMDTLANSLFIEASLQDEELIAEQLLLEHGQLPSVFFRFPGLVSDKALIRCLGNLGLIPLGVDAWLAKGEIPQPGSIILVHGNGNEKPGITKMMAWLDKKDVRWLPLSYLAHDRKGFP
ncbi:MAG: hypothetical protein BGO68_03260 [Candidatus Amoebophilus sp. 36-38]|nr:MAG: hypothetical protein BGO68_03260 [Candidatus Amoebophilus sp. 36-38]